MFPRRIVVIAALTWLALPGVASAQDADHTVIRPAARVGPPWLGLTLQSKPKGDGTGVEVTGLLRRSPSDGTGIEVGDRIVAVAGTTVDSLREIQNVVRDHASGEQVDVVVTRRAKREVLKFTLAAMPSGEEIVRNHLIGYPAPEFTFRFVGDGKDVHLSELRGKPTIIDFWATWCGPCHRVQAQLADVKTKFGDRINIVGISDEPAKVVRDHLERFPAHYAMGVDEGDSRAAYAVQSIPMIVLLDGEQRVAAVIFGAHQQELLEKKLANLVSAN